MSRPTTDKTTANAGALADVGDVAGDSGAKDNDDAPSRGSKRAHESDEEGDTEEGDTDEEDAGHVEDAPGKKM